MSNNFNWKGKTLNQVISKIQLNKGIINDIYGPTPIKSYRREIASNMDDVFTSGNQRTSIKIDEINRPSGSIVVSNNTSNTGIKSIIIVESEKNAVEEEKNSLKKVRNGKSSTIDGETDGEYFADTQQYLKNRGKTFEQNLTYTVKVENSSAYTNKLKFKTLTETVMSDTNTQNTDLLYAVPVENLKKKGGNPFPINSREKLKKMTEYIDEPIVSITSYKYNRSVLLNNSPFIIDNEFSVCFWLFPINNSGSNWYFYFNGINGNQQVYFSIKTDNNTNPEIYLEQNGQKYYFPNMSYNSWYHITVVVANNSFIRCYLNGTSVLENSFNWSNGNITNSIFELGKSGIIDVGPNKQNIANAYYSDVRIYNISLSIGDILLIYNNGVYSLENVINSNLLYQYYFNDVDYYVANNIRYIQNRRNIDLNNVLYDGTIKDNENTMIHLDRAFSFNDNNYITANNGGLTVCFWIYPIDNTGAEWIFNFTGFYNTSQPLDLSIKKSNINNLLDPGIYSDINNQTFFFQSLLTTNGIILQ